MDWYRRTHRPKRPSLPRRLTRLGTLLALSLACAGAVAAAAVLPGIGHARPAKKRHASERHPSGSTRASGQYVLLLGRQSTMTQSVRENAGTAVAFRFQDKTPGVAHAVNVYVQAASKAKQIVAGLYANRGSSPGARLASVSGAAGPAGKWLTLSLPQTTIVKRHTYWIALLARHGAVELAAGPQSGCHSVTDRTVGLAALPRAWKPGAASATCVSAYVSGTRKSSTGPPPDSPPSNSTPPQINGAADVGATLTASTGSWTGSPTSYTYQWRDCDSGTGCVNIAGATASSYTVQSTDQGHTLGVTVTATNAYGSSAAN